MSGRVQAKVVLVTGAGRGQGEAHARLLAREGATVIITDVRERQAAEVAQAIGGESWASPLDVADADAWADLMRRIDDRHGRLDGLVNNAGVALMADLHATDADLFARLDGLTVQLPPLRARRGESPYLFTRLLVEGAGGRPPTVDVRVVERVCLYDWPFNVRELGLLVKRLLVLHGD